MSSSTIHTFFQYSTDKFVEVRNAYTHILNSEDTVSLDEIGLNNKRFVYYGQSGQKNHNENSSSDKKDIVEVLESNRVYIKTPPLIHPAFVKEIAEILNLSIKDLFGIANYEVAIIEGKRITRNVYDKPVNTGPYHIKSMLESKNKDSSSLMITRIPLLPIQKRPFLPCLFDHTIPGVDNLNYQLLSTISKELLAVTGHKDLFFANSHKALQQYFEELIVSINEKLQDDRWSTIKQVREIKGEVVNSHQNDTEIAKIISPLDEFIYVPLYREDIQEEMQNIPIDVLYLDKSMICIQYPHNIIFYNFTNQKIETEIEVECFQLCDINIQKKIIQFFGNLDEDKHQMSDFIHYNVDSKEWFTGEFEEFSYVEFSHQIEKQRLIDYKNDIEFYLHELATFPSKKIRSTCSKYMWITDKYNNGGVFCLKSGLCVFFANNLGLHLNRALPILKPKECLSIIESNAALEDQLYGYQKSNQFELGALIVFEKKHLLLCDTILYHNGQPILEIAFPYSCAGFNRDASQLFLISTIGIIIMDIRCFLEVNTIKYDFIDIQKMRDKE
ncbi:hypothetical protein [Aquimarina sediminis]|uniref:hypothetical protein n=1 Tax=Aquimarina sediminis TaxID=2070536 RepID=UPI000CA00A1E|nr:hypothetical protein [Aquimarina sediminis]